MLCISQALRRNDTIDKFQKITEKIEAALSEISYNKLEISEEVQEQVIIQLHGDSNLFLSFVIIIFNQCAFLLLQEMFWAEIRSSSSIN